MSAALFLTIIQAILGETPSLFTAISGLVHDIEGTPNPNVPYAPIGSQIATDTEPLEAELQAKSSP